MGGASRLIMLLSSPFPLLYPRPSALRIARHSKVSISSFSSISSRKFSCCSRPRLGLFSINASEQIHSSTSSVTREDYCADPSGSLPNSKALDLWPEWSKLLENLRACGYFDGKHGSSVTELNGEDGFSVYEDLPDEFVRTAKACLAFARDRPELLGLISRKDIEIVVEKGTPFLFKSGVDSVRRMKSFLRALGSSELDFEKASTVDLMRFLLSYAWNSLDRESLPGGNIESSVRNLLSELADASRSFQESNYSGSFPKQFPDRFEQTVRPYRQNIEMKRGDWICPRCNFMNFARNMKCLECDEARPKRQLTGGEWECPQCDFFNHGRNFVCLRCDCKHPGEASLGTGSPRSGEGYSNEHVQYHGNVTIRNGLQTSNGTDPPRTSDLVNQSLNSILSHSAVSGTGNGTTMDGETLNTGTGKNSISNFASTLNKQSDGKKSDYVPFVPLPADMFGKPQKTDMKEEQATCDNNADPAKVDGLMNSFSGRSGNGNSFPSEKPVYQTQSKEDKEQDEKSERWFKKVAELHDVPDISSAISDEDFPEIMPMRKGENRFVVSKKKDRSLTSPQYKRRMAMEQSNATNYVPFVPFPPDYFAKKDKQPETGASTQKDMGGSNTMTPEQPPVSSKFEEYMAGAADSGAVGNSVPIPENQQTSKEGWNTSFSAKRSDDSRLDHCYGRPSINPTYRSDSLGASDSKNWKTGSWKDRSDAGSPVSSSTPQSGNSANSTESWKTGFSGKSLEGSLVKEPDPLDMSEEAKAERWFRRAAQIKDISELSQIPDEDFPQIMPMRKGVNRFVVSKRKTPLERRLTSPQYRRNLPIVSSEPLKKENNEG